MEHSQRLQVSRDGAGALSPELLVQLLLFLPLLHLSLLLHAFLIQLRLLLGCFDGCSLGDEFQLLLFVLEIQHALLVVERELHLSPPLGFFWEGGVLGLAPFRVLPPPTALSG